MFSATTPSSSAAASAPAGSNAATQAPAGFSLSASPAAPQSAAPVTTSSPFAGFGTATPAAAAAAAAAPVAVELPAPPSYAKLFEKVCRDRAMSDAFTQEIKKRFSAPMEVKTAAVSGTGNAASGVPHALTIAQQVGAQWKSELAPQASQTGAVLTSSATAPGTSTLARNSEAPQRQQQRQLQVENAQNLLQILLMCDSGFNNSEAPPAGNVASSHWAEAGEEAVKGLHAAVGAVSASAASNLIAFVKASVVRHTQALDGESTTATSLFEDGRRRRANDDPTLLAAQCLYLLSRHFQLTASVVKEALDLIDALYFLLKNSLRSRLVALTTFCEGNDTCALNALTWLCVFSVVNMAAVWKKLRATSGELRLNELIHSNIASSIDTAVSSLRKRLRESVQTSSSAANGGGFHGADVSARASAASLMPPAVYTWQVIVDSYLSILTLAEGCLLRAKGSEQGYDKALDAFLGERSSTTVSSMSLQSVSGPAASPANVALHRGKATKRMVELAPVPRALSIPVDLLYIAPYEIMSYLFDEMLPLLHHLSELEVGTHRRYIEQLEELPRISSVMHGGNNNNRSSNSNAGFQQRTGDGDDGWLRRTTRMGLHGEVVGEPFTSEMAHLLEALAMCLQHLPPEVLNPDLDSDCAATFFIFKNFVKHMRQVFATQRSDEGGSGAPLSASSSSVWENYTLKLVTKFLEVLAMIGRNPQYTLRVMVLLTDAQTECGELQWPSLVGQALECAGFNSGVLSVPSKSGGDGGMSLTAIAAAAAAAQTASSSSASPSPSAFQNGRGSEAADAYAASSTLFMGNGVPRSLHRQFTRQYTSKCQRQFVSSFFLLLRQLFANPTLRPTVSAYINLELALTFLLAPHQSQVMLGSTLSLISAFITNASDAQLVWTFLEQRQLLQQPSTRTKWGSGPVDGTAALYDRFTANAGAKGAAASPEPTAHEETSSLIGHCQYECTQGTYDITIGFLHLITALLQNDQPSMAALGGYTTVVNFISQEILRGVLKRVFTFQQERYTVFALAAAALRQALLVRFQGENGRVTGIPFAIVLAINKAPADVVGEVVKLVLEMSDAPHELLGHHRAAVRQALQLLITAIQTVQEQKIEMLLFDTRTTLNTDLAVRVLGLCSVQDTLLTKMTLRLLLLFPFETANQAAHYWSGLTVKYAPVLESFTQLLHPLCTVPMVVQAPPELAQLDFDPAELVPGWPSALLVDTKSLLLDLLMRHADVTEPSLTAWMCGFYHEEYAARDRRMRAGAATSGSGTTDACESGSGESSWWRSTLLTSVVEGACSPEVEAAHPTLAVRYVKLLYLLRANRLYGALVVRPFLESVCQTLFLRLQHFRASQCTPVALSKYAYVLKLLALEACYTHRTSPGDLRLAQSSSIPSISVEVLLSLLYPFGAGVDGEQANMSNTKASVPGGATGSGGFITGSFVEGVDSTNANGRRDGDNSGYGAEGVRSKDRRFTGAVTIVSRDAAVDIASWLPQALQVLPTFPEKLPPISGGRSHLVPCAADGVVQYNMASLYEAFQLEQMRANKPRLTMAELREKLRPFIVANDCFFSYAAGVSFVEGWCQLVSVSCSVVQGLSMSRLRAFALCILRGLDATTAMTAAAQEQICTRLCHCLSTVMAHLRRVTLIAADRRLLAAPHMTKEAEWDAMYKDSSVHQRDVSDDALLYESAGAAGQRQASERESARLASSTHVSRPGKRRPRDDSAALHAQVGNFYGISRRSQLAQAVLQRHQEKRMIAADAVSASVSVLQPLVRALVQWGTRIATIRADLYMSLLCLAETPGINLDDVVLWRSQKALLNVICADICSGCASTSATVSPTAPAGASADRGHGAPRSSKSGSGAAGANANTATEALSPQVQHAIALLVALLQASAPIRDDFCNPNAGSGDGMSTWALRCTTALLQSVDNAVCAFFSNSGVPLGALLWHIRSAFDLLSVVSLGHASQVLHSDLLRFCFAMQAWKYSTQVVLGYSQASLTHEQIISKPLVEQNKEVLRRLLLSVTRWVNLLLSSFGDATPLLYEVQKFIRENRSLVDYVFISPAAVSSTLPGSARLSGSHLTLCAELSECLRALSNSVLAVDCRTLVDSMALPDLLNILSSEEVWQRGPTNLYDFTDADCESGMAAGVSSYGSGGFAAAAAAPGAPYDAAAGGVGEDGLRNSAGGALVKRVGGTAAALSRAERGRNVVALTVRNLSHLLLNAEYGLRGMEVDLISNNNGAATPMLRFSVSKRNLCLQIVRHVAHSLVEIARAKTHEFRLECYVYALHALICLLHSFVLPLTHGASLQQTPEDFLRYLKQLPLQEIMEVLMQSHEAVYCLKWFNTDFRGGMRVHRLDAHHPRTAGVEAGEADNNFDVATRSLSNGMRPSSADGEGIHPLSVPPLSTPKSAPAAHSADTFSVPSTPGLLPAADARRGGRDLTSFQGPTQRAPGATRTSSPRNGVDDRHGGPSADVAGSSHNRDANSTLVHSLPGNRLRGLYAFGVEGSPGAEAADGLSAETNSMMPVIEGGEKLHPDSTLWELLPPQAVGGDEWSRVYDSFQNNGALSSDLELAGNQKASPQWTNALNLENEVRQIKVAIANALRATKGALGAVRKME
ncbi:hypothetical protein ABL78_3427 [Leptomonas seymouri]|uniref:Uncharacterized protein n=1 Tax=Leptomonas seymouri TaxID=5684 RepID=A0A0N1I4S5_LEPSE|nr:hypothetical protein ABL78_3427 [Leptomonas seymouri]|eukprot:KPI87478.1 hypothetical protein ABL78_3427 [Leptomonas seymouri]